MARSPYEKRNPLQLITPIESYPEIKAIEEIRPNEAIQPIAKYHGLQDKRRTYQDLAGESFIADYNDPTELNSYLDALVNKEAVSKRFGEVWGTTSTLSGQVAVIAYGVGTLAALAGLIAAPFTAGASAGAGVGAAAKIVAASKAVAATAKTVAKIAAIPAIPAAVDVTYNYGIKPIAKGEYAQAGINTLMNIGETTDYLSNPIKGLIQEGPKGLYKASGLSDEGRFNYNFDSGSFVTDVFLEMIVDPSNWTRWAASGIKVPFTKKYLVKGSSVKVAKPAVTPQAERIVRNAMEEVVTKFKDFNVDTTPEAFETMVDSLSKSLAEEAFRYSGSGLEEQIINLAKSKMSALEWIDPAKKALKDDVIARATKEIQRQFQHRVKVHTAKALRSGYTDLTKEQIELIYKHISQYDTGIIGNTTELILDSTTSQIVNSLSELSQITASYDRHMNKMALHTSGMGLGITGARNIWKDGRRLQRSMQLNKLKNAKSINALGDINISDIAGAEKSFKETQGYILLATGEAAEHNSATFNIALSNQLKRDALSINRVLAEEGGDLLLKAEKLDRMLKEQYQLNFLEYVEKLKAYSEANGNRYKGLVSRLEYTHQLLVLGSVTEQSTGLDKLSSAFKPDRIYKDAIKKAEQLHAQSLELGFNPNKADISVNVLRLDNAASEQMFLNNEVLTNVFKDFNNVEGSGAAFRNLLDDPNFYASVHPDVTDSMQEVLNVAAGFENSKNLRTHLSMIAVPPEAAKGIGSNRIKEAYLGALSSYWKLTPSEALLKIDSISNAIWDTVSYQHKTSFRMYPEMQEHFKLALENFIRSQIDAGADLLTNPVGQHFTTAVRRLKDAIEEYPNLKSVLEDDLLKLEQAALATEITASEIRAINDELGLYWFSDAVVRDDAQNVFSLLYDDKTSIGRIGYEELFNTDTYRFYFEDVPEGMPVAYYKGLADLASDIETYYRKIRQEYIFRPKNGRIIDAIYNDIYKTIMKTPEQYASLEAVVGGDKIKQYLPAFSGAQLYKHLVQSGNPEIQYAQMQALWKAIKTAENSELLQRAFISSFADVGVKNAAFARDLLRYVQNPELLQASPEIFDPMIKQTTLSNRRISKNVMHAVDRADAFQTQLLRDGVNNFDEYIRLSAEYNQNTAVAKLHERQIAPIKRANNLSIELDKEYSGRFNKTIADENITFVEDILNKDAKLYEEHSTTLSILKQYYQGVLSDNHLFSFEEMWERVREMNADLAAYQKSQYTREFLIKRIREVYRPDDTFVKKWLEDDEFVDHLVELYNSTSLTDAEMRLMNELHGEARIHTTYKKLRDNVNTQDHLPKALQKRPNSVVNPFVEVKNVSPWDPTHDQRALDKVLRDVTEAQQVNAASRILSLEISDLKKELANRGRIVSIGGLTHDKTFNNNLGAFKRYYSQNIELFKENGIHAMWDENRVTIILDKTQHVGYSNGFATLNTEPVERALNLSNFQEVEALDKYLDRGDNYFTENVQKYRSELEELTGRSLGDSQGDLLTEDVYREIYESIPKELAAELPAFESMVAELKQAPVLYNESLLGSTMYKNSITQYNGDIVANLKNSANQMYLYTRTKSEYLGALMNSTNSISHPESVLSNFTNEELYGALRFNDDYKLVALVEDKRYGARLQEIYPISVDDIDKARALNANIVPLNVYTSIYNTVNHRIGSTNKFMKIISSVMYKMKGGALARSGAFVRNYVDTHMKSHIEIGEESGDYLRGAKSLVAEYDEIRKALVAISEINPEEMTIDMLKTKYPELYKEWFKYILETATSDSGSIKYQQVAHKLIKDVDELNKEIMKFSNQGIGNREAIETYFAKMKTPMSLETYDELTTYFEESMASYTIRGKSELIYGSDNAAIKALNKIDESFGAVIEWGNSPEAYNRLAVHLSNIDKGLTYSQSLQNITKVHFDYTFRDKFAQIAELIYPFISFSALNMQYWVDMLDRNPWMLRQYANLLTPTWDFDKYTPEQINNSRQLQNKILNGYIPLFTIGEGQTFNIKLGMSAIDSVMLMSNPLNFTENLNPYLSAAKELIETGNIYQPLQLIPQVGMPIQGVITGAKQMTPFPSLFNRQYPVRERQSYQQRSRGTVSPHIFSNTALRKSNQYWTDNRTPKFRQNTVLDPYHTIGAKRYRSKMYPVINVSQSIKNRVSTNVYNRIKNRVQTDVYKGIRYNMRLDVNRFR